MRSQEFLVHVHFLSPLGEGRTNISGAQQDHNLNK